MKKKLAMWMMTAMLLCLAAVSIAQEAAGNVPLGETGTKVAVFWTVMNVVVGNILPLALSFPIQTHWATKTKQAWALGISILIGIGSTMIQHQYQPSLTGSGIADFALWLVYNSAIIVGFVKISYENFWKVTGVTTAIQDATSPKDLKEDDEVLKLLDKAKNLTYAIEAAKQLSKLSNTARQKVVATPEGRDLAKLTSLLSNESIEETKVSQAQTNIQTDFINNLAPSEYKPDFTDVDSTGVIMGDEEEPAAPIVGTVREGKVI